MRTLFFLASILVGVALAAPPPRAASGVGASFGISAAAKPNVRAVTKLDIKKYMGDWNEIARLPQEFQKQCVSNSRARYDLQKNGTVSVTNECQRGDGSTDVAEGAARLHDKNEPAKFDVTFAPPEARGDDKAWQGKYWIMAIDDDYQWALVGEPSATSLWILARKDSLDGRIFKLLKALAQSQGYDNLENLIVGGKII